MMGTEKDAEAWFKWGLEELRWQGADSFSEYDEQMEKAVSFFDKATSLKPDYAEAWFYKGEALADVGDYSSAVAANEEVLRLNPDHTEAWRHKGDALRQLKRYAEVLAAYQEVRRLRPEDFQARFHEAEALSKLGRYEQAVPALKEFLRSQPDHADWPRPDESPSLEARFLLGNALASLGRNDEAKAEYREAILLTWKQNDFSSWLSDVLTDALRNVDAARQTYIEMLEASPQNHWTQAGEEFLSAGRPEEALQAYEAAIRLVPEDAHRCFDAELWFGKAEALVQTGRREEAVAAYREARRIWPKFIPAKRGLEGLLRELGQDKKPTQEGN